MGHSNSNPHTPTPTRVQQTIIVTKRKSNGLGTAGFVLALLGLIFCWVPLIGWILWLLGAIFSFIGIFKSPRGLAIVGLILSFIGFLIMGAAIGVILASV